MSLTSMSNRRSTELTKSLHEKIVEEEAQENSKYIQEGEEGRSSMIGSNLEFQKQLSRSIDSAMVDTVARKDGDGAVAPPAGAENAATSVRRPEEPPYILPTITNS